MANNELVTRGTAHWQLEPMWPLISTTIAFNALIALGTGTNTVTALAVNGRGVRLTQDTNEAADLVLSGPIGFQANKTGLLTLRARVRINTTLTAAAFFIGFQDIITTGQLSYEDAAIVSTPADGFGILYESEQSLTQLYHIGVGNDVDDTIRITTNGDTIVLATFVTFDIEATSNNGTTGADTGVVRYRVKQDGKILKSAGTNDQGWITSRCRSTVVLAPVLNLCGRATAHTFDTVEFYADGAIGDTFD